MINKIIFLVSVLFFNVQAKELSIGNEILGVDYILKNIDGNDTSLDKLKKSNGILVVFSCNTCPWVIRWQDRYNILSAFSRKNDIGFVAVNSNARLHESVDSMDEMIYHATTNEYGFPYVLDKDAKLAKAFGAMKTPHVYLFNSDNKLVYTGAIDDNAKSAKKVKNNYLMDAIRALGTNKKIKISETKALGCSIKY
ncbi:MAG: redoxin family protein [Candidatus Neomarinimicrobiota bacterium]|jgi:peroxiredoxin